MDPTSNFPSISGTQQQSTSTAQPPSNDGSEGASGSFVQHKVDISKYSKPMVLKYYVTTLVVRDLPYLTRMQA